MIYLDTSALIKLVIEEAESEALEHWLLLQEAPFTTSEISRVELIRACRRIDPATMANANLLLNEIPYVPLDSWIVETAQHIGPPTLRSLDALHLASAIQLGDALTGFVVYDKRLRDAAALVDLPAMTPGAA